MFSKFTQVIEFRNVRKRLESLIIVGYVGHSE